MNRNTLANNKLIREKEIQESTLIKVPYKCRSCVYYPPENRICFYGYVPPCKFKKNKDVCKRWFKILQTKINP